ncbi:MAG: hypothetical protein KatS3mg105_4664 [Gemmatales bacterium]|nr:MAG: hypothetical protein KatS3mg105_4664 [Gemmatales bacterium]
MADPIETEIDQAISSSDVNRVRELFGQHPDYIHRRWNDYLPWLDLAVSQKNPQIVKTLLECGCDVNQSKGKSDFETPLFSALCEDDPAMVKLLLEHGADPNRHKTVITAIVGMNEHSLELVKLLEEHGADLHAVYMNEITNEPMNALSAAIDWGKDDVAEYLRSKGAVLPTVEKLGNNSAGDDSVPDQTNLLADEVKAYFKENFGPVNPLALVEIVPTTWPPISIHVIPASEERKHITLFTTGMSDEPMTVPEPGGEDDRWMLDYRWAEIYIQLPADWDLSNLGDPKWRWPIDWLRSTAAYPHANETWLGGPVTIIANGDPPEPLSPNTNFTSLLLLADKWFTSRDGRTVQLYRMAPIYTEERELEISQGIDELLRRFDSSNINFVVDLDRPNVGKR